MIPLIFACFVAIVFLTILGLLERSGRLTAERRANFREEEIQLLLVGNTRLLIALLRERLPIISRRANMGGEINFESGGSLKPTTIQVWSDDVLFTKLILVVDI